jgi:hypothetical protein
MGDVCLEEFLELDLAPDGICLSPALHYNEGSLLGDECVDQIMHGTSYVGWRRCVGLFLTSHAVFPYQYVVSVLQQLDNKCVLSLTYIHAHICRSQVSDEFQETARDTLLRFMKASGPLGPGGVDFLSVSLQTPKCICACRGNSRLQTYM